MPLTDDALGLLRDLPRLKGTDFLFPSAKGGALSDATLASCMKAIHAAREREDGIGYVDARSGRPAVPHGLRSLFRDWCAEVGVDRDLAELQLAHTVGDAVERAYRRSDMIERRREVLATWARVLRGCEAAKVVKLEAAK